MNGKHSLVLGALISLSTTSNAQAQSSDYFSGFYGGFEGGAISYDTQITFDGVDDPAGRGGAGYGAFFGYNHTYEKLSVGAELLFNLASDPDPYTFDPAVVGFAELDLRRGDVPPPAVPLAMLDLKPLAVPGAEAFCQQTVCAH